MRTLTDILRPLTPEISIDVFGDKGEAYDKACKQAIDGVRAAVDNGWLFISKSRREDRHPTGIGIACFVDGVLYVGASACKLPTQKPSIIACRTMAEQLKFPVGMLFQARDLMSRHDAWRRCDKWRPYVGKWKALCNNMPMDPTDGEALMEMVCERRVIAERGRLAEACSLPPISMRAEIAQMIEDGPLPYEFDCLFDNEFAPYSTNVLVSVVCAACAAISKQEAKQLSLQE